jgi:hypothetical protein
VKDPGNAHIWWGCLRHVKTWPDALWVLGTVLGEHNARDMDVYAMWHLVSVMNSGAEVGELLRLVGRPTMPWVDEFEYLDGGQFVRTLFAHGCLDVIREVSNVLIANISEHAWEKEMALRGALASGSIEVFHWTCSTFGSFGKVTYPYSVLEAMLMGGDAVVGAVADKDMDLASLSSYDVHILLAKAIGLNKAAFIHWLVPLVRYQLDAFCPPVLYEGSMVSLESMNCLQHVRELWPEYIPPFKLVFCWAVYNRTGLHG